MPSLSDQSVEPLEISWQGTRVPYLAEYLGIWMYEPQQFLLGVQQIQRMNIAQHVQSERMARLEERRGDLKQETSMTQVRRGYSYEVTDGVATVQISGSLMKHVSSMDESTSTVMLRNTVRQMSRDPNVKAVILVIDSPGGTVSGAYDLADDIANLAKVKPVYAYAEDLCASAAYLMASQTRGVSANGNALVGSIGTYGVIYDYSQMFEKEGVKAIVLSSGDMKGVGTPGTEITPEQVEYLQDRVNKLNALFIQYVAKGRKMDEEKVKTLANGRVYVGSEAIRKGLIERIETFDDCFNRVWKEANPDAAGPRRASRQSIGQITAHDQTDKRIREIESPPKTKESTAEDAKPEEGAAVASAGKADAEAEQQGGADMATQVTDPAPGPKADEPKPASIAELQKEFATDPSFALEAAKNAWTMTEAKAAYADKLRQENTTLRDENAKLKESQTKQVGVAPVSSKSDGSASTRADGGGDAEDELEQRIEPLVKAGKTRQQAIHEVFARDEDFRVRYVKARNEKAA